MINNNNKRFVTVIVVILIIVAGGYLIVHNHHKQSSTNNQANVAASYTAEGMPACNLFTSDQAKALLGASAIAEPKTPLSSHSTASYSQTTCPYTTQSGDLALQTSYQVASLVVQYAKNATGITGNQNGYDASKKLGSNTAIASLGDEAFYSSTYGEMSVIKGNYWLTGTVSSISPSGITHNQASAKQIVQEALARL